MYIFTFMKWKYLSRWKDAHTGEEGGLCAFIRFLLLNFKKIIAVTTNNVLPELGKHHPWHPSIASQRCPLYRHRTMSRRSETGFHW